MAERLADRIAAIAGAEVTSLGALHGGDLSDVHLAHLAGGGAVVAKTGPLVEAEGRMLRAIAKAGARVPKVIGAAQGLLVMEHLDETRASAPGWHALGAELATLHATTGAQYGWAEDYGFGPVTLPNAPLDDWPRFWAERRLLARPDALPRDIRLRVETLCTHLHDLLPCAPPPALLHGDLWSGNVLFMADGAALIDPACYYGDAEVDLAMLHLFGTPDPAFFDGYGHPAPGWRDRLPIYQLWPALVHLRLFGPGYRGMVERFLSAAGA